MNETKCFFYGLGIGVAAGILFAPRAGEKTRDRLSQKARENQEYLAREAAGLRNVAIEKLNRAKRAAKATADGIGAAFEDGKGELLGRVG
jgi:gas vesicle protein